MSTVERSQKRSRVEAPVTSVLPLALFEAIREHDLPEEVLEEEDLTASLPRRLGLKGVVDNQIRRYQDDVARRRSATSEEVRGLFRLVLRRPDAETIFFEAGQRVAQRHFKKAGAASATMVRVLPRSLRWAGLRAGARSVLRRILGGGVLEVKGRPMKVRIASALSAQADATGTACAFYSGVLEELISLFLHRRMYVVHDHCTVRIDGVCEWTLVE